MFQIDKHIIYKLTSPLFVVLLTWSVALLIFGFASSLDYDYDYFHLLVQQEGILDKSTIYSYILIFLCIVVFSFGAIYAKLIFSSKERLIIQHLKINNSVNSLLIVFVFTSIIAFLWIGVAVIQFGGLLNLAAVAASENVLAREAILAASFPGGRLISSGFVGLTIYCSVLLSYDKFNFRRQKNVVIFVFIISLLYLGVVPILTSGRVNFFIAILGSFISACYVQKKLIGTKFLFIGLIFLAIVWTSKQYFTLGHIAEETSAVKQGIEGILFYFYNDILNALNTIDKTDGNYTYGWYSIRFIFYFTFTDKLFLQSIVESRDHISQYVTAGEVPLLGAHVVDFGYFGFATLFMVGFITQYFYLNAIIKITYAAFYGLICACLVLAIHSSYLTSQEVIYSMILLKFLFWKSS